MKRYLVRQCTVSRGRLCIAITWPFLTAAVQFMTWGYIKPLAWFLFYPTIFFAPMIGGLCGGVSATALSTVLVWFIFIKPNCPQQISYESASISMCVFFVMGMLFTAFHIRYYNLSKREAYSEATIQNNLFMRKLTDNVPCAISYWTLSQTCNFHNKIFCDWYEVMYEGTKSKTILETLGEPMFVVAEPHIKAVLKGKPQSYERTTISKSGNARYTLLQYVPDIASDGRVQGFVSIETDVTRQKLMEMELIDANAILSELSTVDSLTGIGNRRAFDERLQTEWERAKRTELPIGLLMIDIDHFKQYNDHGGHCEGDCCLKKVADAIASIVRHSPDFVARYGGDEFACILPGADVAAAYEVAKRIIDELRGRNIPKGFPGLDVNVTISIGGTSITPEGAVVPKDIIETADRNLYRAKESGRNNLVVI